MLKRLLRKFSILRELLYFFWENKMWWLIPMVIALVLIGLILIFSQITGIAPFIYTLF